MAEVIYITYGKGSDRSLFLRLFDHLHDHCHIPPEAISPQRPN